jgi:hypothetical protein
MTPQFLLIKMKGLLLGKRVQTVLQDIFMFLKYSNTVLLKGYVKDEV